jgi:3-deoxy-D-manno-octulosonic-acid transferase
LRSLYSIGIRIYRFVIGIAALRSTKAHKWIHGRKNWRNKLAAECTRAGERKRILFHCASLGEFEQARPVIEAFRKQHPDWFVTISFFSPSGYEVRNSYAQADYVCYLPLDTPFNAQTFAKLLKPDLAVFVKYEFWYNILSALQAEGCKTILIAGRFRSDQLFFKPYGNWFTKQLRQFSFFHLQDKESAKLLHSIQIDAVEVSGDPRFDRVLQNALNAEKISEIELWLNSRKCVIAGSTWEPDENLLLPWKYEEALIIAPHEIGEKGLNRIESLAGKKVARFSELLKNPSLKSEILLIDNIGMLMRIYAYANWAWVGGGFGSGLHNILEPAAFGIPVYLGPEHSKFPEAEALIKAGGAFSVQSKNELDVLLKKNQNSSAAGFAAGNFVHAEKGATSKIIQTLESLC